MDSTAIIERVKQRNEEWFFARMAETPIPVSDMESALADMAEVGKVDTADGLADLLQARLFEKGELADGLRILAWRAVRRGHEAPFRKTAEKVLADALKERPWSSFLSCCGLDKGVSLSEGMRRLVLMQNLKSGALCMEKTWGFGVVKSVDDYGRRVYVDFEKKPAHSMALDYAAETLRLVPENHILARKHRDPAAIATMKEKDQAGLIKLVITSFGPKTAPELQRILQDFGIVEEAQWKSFWDAARKGLKKDPHVDLPAKRSELIRIMEGDQKYNDAWYAALSKEKDMDTIIERMELMSQEAPDTAEAKKAILADRAAFAAKGARNVRSDLLAKLVLLAGRLPLKSEAFDPDAVGRSLLEDKVLLSTLSSISARDTGRLLEVLLALEPESGAQALIRNLAFMGNNSFQESMKILAQKNKEQDAAVHLRGVVAQEPVGLVILAWLARQSDRIAELGICTYVDLFRLLVESMERQVSFEELKAQKLVRALFDQNTWVEHMFRMLDNSGRALIVRKVAGARNWEGAEKRGLLARILKVDPSLESLLTLKEQEPEEKAKAKFTSWRSYRERSAQYKKLIETDIPANSQEIALARSYGDLRENFEYKAAKEHQTVLLRKKDELEVDLKIVKGTDFDGVSVEVAGMGTEVNLRKADGREEKIRILGEWDRSEELGIISNQSPMGKALEGKKVGERVVIPNVSGEETVEILSVGPLADDIKAWVRG